MNKKHFAKTHSKDSQQTICYMQKKFISPLKKKAIHEKPSPNTKCSGEDSKLFSSWIKGKNAISTTYSLVYTVQKARPKQLDKKNKQKAFKVTKRYSYHY